MSTAETGPGDPLDATDDQRTAGDQRHLPGGTEPAPAANPAGHSSRPAPPPQTPARSGEQSGPANTGPRTEAAGRIELLISTLLRTGVLTSIAIIAAGTIISFVHHPSYLRSVEEVRRLTQPGAAFPRTLRQVYDGLFDFRGQAFVALGLVLLIATPVARVAVSVLIFIAERDRIFTLVTSIVLALLLLSFVLGRVAG